MDGESGTSISQASISKSNLDSMPATFTSMLGIIPASQSLADRLIAAGYVGLRVQSFAPSAGTDDLNLVFWRSRCNSGYLLLSDT